MKLYTDDGYLNFDYISRINTPFIFIVGGRGIGKTFGALKHEIENKRRFILLRRTQTQTDLALSEAFSPFKAINEYMGLRIMSFPVTKYNSAFWNTKTDEDGKIYRIDEPICYGASLSTFSSLRGFDGSDVLDIVFDEFIAERHERPIKNEAKAFFNMYETINRNRELQGKEAVKAYCLANSNDVANPIFTELGIVNIALKMQEERRETYTDIKRGFTLISIQKSPISQKKANTALYRLTQKTSYVKMALSNKYADNIPSRIEQKALIEYKPVVKVGELTIYRHKYKDEYYVTTHHSGSCQEFDSGESDLKRFQLAYRNLFFAYMKNAIVFEGYAEEVVFLNYFNQK